MLQALYWEMVCRNQDLGISCAHCHWDVIDSRLSEWTELGNDIYSTHIHTDLWILLFHIYIYFCVHLYMCLNKSRVSTDISDSNPAGLILDTPHPPLVVYLLSLIVKNMVLIMFNVFIYCSVLVYK